MIASSDFYEVPSTVFRAICVSIIRDMKFCKFACHFGGPFYVSFLIFWLLAFFQVAFCYRAITIPGNFDISSFCLSFASICYHTMASVKIISMSIASNELNHLFDVLDKIHPKTTKLQRQYNIHGWLSKTKRMMKLYFLMLFCMMGNFVFIPLCIRLKVFIETGLWQLELVLKMWLPFETESLFPFSVVYVLQGWIGFTSTSYITSVDILVLAIVQLVSAHFNVIQQTFERIQPDVAMNDLKTIKRCIVHQNVLNEWVGSDPSILLTVCLLTAIGVFFFFVVIHRISEKLNEIFRISNLVNYAGNTIVMCLMGFRLMIAGINEDFLLYAFSVITIATQTYCWAWMGDKLSESVRIV